MFWEGKMKRKKLELLVTLWPSFPHFKRFAIDGRLAGIRLNSAMVNKYELDNELDIIKKEVPDHIPMYFDIKGRQLRVTESFPYPDHLELKLNHTISVKTPTIVLFKAGADYALMDRIVDGNHLIFEGGPKYLVDPGESLHIRDPSLVVTGPTILPVEVEKVEKAKKAGFDKFCLSYVEGKRCIDEFRDYVGDAHIVAKIENKKGLDYVANHFKKKPNLSLMAARGDLYVEVDKPHHILEALKLIISKDKEACAGSRMLLSTIRSPVPECSDFSELAWLYDIGYRNMMLCDEICLKEELLARAVNAFDAFRQVYAK
ncbi:hypothetical protein FJZ53_02885 [Candidatus Woesearchaeota archaeon]|nr:hypothetical protein [Candidatus Woesearchaeota archaeon]